MSASHRFSWYGARRVCETSVLIRRGPQLEKLDHTVPLSPMIVAILCEVFLSKRHRTRGRQTFTLFSNKSVSGFECSHWIFLLLDIFSLHWSWGLFYFYYHSNVSVAARLRLSAYATCAAYLTSRLHTFKIILFCCLRGSCLLYICLLRECRSRFLIDAHFIPDAEGQVVTFSAILLQMEVDDMPHDIATALRSELAALQYKKDRLQAEVITIFISCMTHGFRCCSLFE